MRFRVQLSAKHEVASVLVRAFDCQLVSLWSPAFTVWRSAFILGNFAHGTSPPLWLGGAATPPPFYLDHKSTRQFDILYKLIVYFPPTQITIYKIMSRPAQPAVKILIQAPPQLRDSARKLANMQGQSLSEFIRRAIKNHIRATVAEIKQHQNQETPHA